MSDPLLDRNLLFGAMALQDYLIDAQQLGEICVVWAAKMKTPMADLLKERGWITDEDRRQIEKRMERVLKRHGGDVRASLGAVAGAEARDAIRMADAPEVRKSLSGLPPAAGYVLLETMAPPTELQRARYTLSRLHAQGGLGKVWLARDHDLNREVALKEIQPEAAAHPETWRRFLKEAQVTGQLEHPNIIPVYELGRRPEDDQPFYTMRFARGRTMRQAIADHHEQRKQGKADALALHRLLQAFASICQAIGYAHTRGVIHRDLKPENVVLGAFGEVLVLDWGLAKVSDEPEEEGPHKSVEISAEARSDQTRAGSQLGTPSYMAPEQAEGRLDLIDPRTDIYGLGGILFEILTGVPPNKGKTTLEVIDAILSGPAPRARSVDSSVPRALDAICAKALAKARNERYKKATELAEDIERWLADEPVAVYRDPLTTRFARWGRRHKRMASGLAVFLVSTAAMFALVAYLVNLERARTEVQRQLAAANGAKAIANFRLANEAADGMLMEVGDVELADIPQMETVRKKLLAKAKASYEKFLEQKGDEPVVHWGAGRAEARLGNVLDLLGDSKDADAAYSHAIAVLKPLAADDPDNADYRRDLAYAYNGRGILWKKLNRFRDAEADLTEAIRLRKALADASSATVDDRQALAFSRYQLGAVLARVAGRRREQEDAYREAVEAQNGLVAAQRARPELRATLGRFLNNLGMLLASDRSDDAAKTFREALAIENALVEQSPAFPGSRWQLARAANNLGALLARSPVKTDEPALLYQRARALLESLSAEFPSIPQYRRELSSVYFNLATDELKSGHREAALRDFRKAAELLAALTRDHADVVDYRQKASAASIQVYALLAEQNRTDADRQLREALDGQDALVGKYPDVTEYADSAGRDYYIVARMLAARKDYPAALRYIAPAIKYHRAVLAKLPSDRPAKGRLAEDLLVLAQASLSAGDHAATATAADELARLDPDDAQVQLTAASFFAQCATAAASDSQVSPPSKADVAAAYESRAVQILKDAATRKLIPSAAAISVPEFAPLKKHPEFQKLLESLKPPATATG
jgi:tetratricopeptide (TPR) repeat protein